MNDKKSSTREEQNSCINQVNTKNSDYSNQVYALTIGGAFTAIGLAGMFLYGHIPFKADLYNSEGNREHKGWFPSWQISYTLNNYKPFLEQLKKESFDMEISDLDDKIQNQITPVLSALVGEEYFYGYKTSVGNLLQRMESLKDLIDAQTILSKFYVISFISGVSILIANVAKDQIVDASSSIYKVGESLAAVTTSQVESIVSNFEGLITDLPYPEDWF